MQYANVTTLSSRRQRRPALYRLALIALHTNTTAARPSVKVISEVARHQRAYMMPSASQTPRRILPRSDQDDGTPPLFTDESDEDQVVVHDKIGPEIIPPNNISSDALLATSPPQQPLLNRLLKHYVTFMSNPMHQDQSLKLMQWTLWVASRIYDVNTTPRQALQKLSFDLSLARYAARLLHTPLALDGYVNGSWASSSKRHANLFQVFGNVLALSMMGYYPAEHVAWAHWMVPSWLAHGRSAEMWSAWSCRFWLVYVGTELTQCVLQLQELSDDLIKQEKDGLTADVVMTRQTMRRVRYQLWRNVFFLLPAIHFSMPRWDTHPLVPPALINTCMWLESVTCLTQSVTNYVTSRCTSMAPSF